MVVDRAEAAIIYVVPKVLSRFSLYFDVAWATPAQEWRRGDRGLRLRSIR